MKINKDNKQPKFSENINGKIINKCNLKDNNKHEIVNKLKTNKFVCIKDHDNFYEYIYNYLISKKFNTDANNKINCKAIKYPDY